MNVDNVSRDDWLLGGLALLLAIDLLALPWWSLGPFDFSATDGPNGWLGVLAVLAAIAVVVDLGIERLSPQTQVPAMGGSRTTTRLVLAGLAVGCLVLKLLLHTGFAGGFGFWLAVVLAVGLIVIASRARQAPTVVSAGPGTV